MPKASQNSRLAIDFGFHLPPPADRASAETLSVNRQLLERYRSSVLDRERKIIKAENVIADWRVAVIKKVGETNWKKFLEYSRSQRRSQYGLKDLSHDPDGLAELSLGKRKARDKSLSLLKDAKLESGGLKRIHRRFAKKIEDLLSPKEPKLHRLEIVPESKVPRGIRVGKTNPWTIRIPPYDGWAWSYSWNRWGGGDPDLVNYLDVASGSVGHRSEYQNYDAGDFDALWLEFDTSVGVWYQPPHAGQVDMWIRARCVKARSSVWLDDEWGWSDSSTWMHSYITVNVSPSMVDEERSESWWSHAWGNPDSTTYVNDWIAPNSVIWFHLVTSDPIPAGAWTYIKVGTYDHHQSVLNDVSTDSLMRNWWYFEELWFDVL
jgi:hypothetical protein